ncbi:MAG: OsmC family protein [Rikenellaceae bacterium]
MANKVLATLNSGYNVAYRIDEREILQTDASSSKEVASMPSPVDCVSMALSGCMLASIRDTANKYKFAIQDVSLEIEAVVVNAPRRIGEFKIGLFFKGSFSDHEKEALGRAIKSCVVANSLNPEIVKTIVFHYTE